jgi:peroxin-5
MDDFLRQPGQIPQPSVSPFAMDQMRQELDNFAAPSLQQNGWATAFNPQMQAGGTDTAKQMPKPNEFSSSEFSRFRHLQAQNQERTASPVSSGGMPVNSFSSMASRYSGMGMNGMGMGMGMMNRPMVPQDGARYADKGKGRMVELDDKNWEAEFAQIDAQRVDDPDGEAAMAMEDELNMMDRLVSETDYDGDLEAVWRGILAERESSPFEFDNFDFDSFLTDGSPRLNTHDGYLDPQLGNYLFEEENIFRGTSDSFSEGLRIMNEGGNLSLAALAFEAAVQRDPSHTVAWTLLGSAQAQNEKETPAIRALEQAIELDPSNLSALMGLAVSYTNESHDSRAYRTLERWLSVKYPSLIPPAELTHDADMGFTDRNVLHQKVTELFIRAAQLSPDGEHMDPDVQVGLGVLFYGAQEYDKAVDCFSAALASTEAGTSNDRQQVHLLWNRLGATLANSGKPEDAIAAYEKALVLKPNFVRARYNLGVSCINIGCYEEAAQHLLGALAMHNEVLKEGRERARDVIGSGIGAGAGVNGDGGVVLGDEALERMVQQNQSTNLYDTLRRVFGLMNRPDLRDQVQSGMDVDVFRKEFDF